MSRHTTRVHLQQLADELGLDVVGVARAEP
jgi:hypothetical protein